ncbi:hypothetical protein BGX28_006976 [Mortierella sp. GBA30]|nr:hypothetical protein BGX28_006976 [Mortierella sp. GBA30]
MTHPSPNCSSSSSSPHCCTSYRRHLTAKEAGAVVAAEATTTRNEEQLHWGVIHFSSKSYATNSPNPTTLVRRIRSASTRPSSLPLFFILLSLNCLFSTLSPSPSASSTSPSIIKTSFLLIQPCDAARNVNSNQRVDAPSPDDFPPLTGPQFAYTKQTPLSDLKHPREYADGALATQKLIAAPLIPLDRQMWVGVDTRTAYFGNNFGGDKIDKLSQLLQAGVRRLVLDLWWDGTDLGWQVCPRIKRDGTQLRALRLAIEQGQKDILLPSLEHLATVVQQKNVIKGAGSGLHRTHSTSITSQPTTTARHTKKNAHPHAKNSATSTSREPLSNRSDCPKGRSDFHRYDKRHYKDQENKEDDGRKSNKGGKKTMKEKKQGAGSMSNKDKAREWFRKKGFSRRPPIIPVDRRRKSLSKSSTNAPKATGPVIRGAAVDTSRDHHGGKGKRPLTMSKGIVSTYDRTKAVDQTVDGITCSSGEDLVMLLQELQSWIQETTADDLEDVLLIILNLNELGNNSLGSRPPMPISTPMSSPPTPTPSLNGTGSGLNVTAKHMLSNNEDFFRRLNSPNTNPSLKAAMPSAISLKDLFFDAFPNMIYDPTVLERDRADLRASWWKNGPVGLDYYNTTTDPATGKIQAPTGWPTSAYLTDVVNRRVVVGIGVNNLRANTTYNITDDFSTLYRPGSLGQSITNSSQIQFSSALSQELCEFPVPGVMMVPTGREDNLTRIMGLRNDSDTITKRLSWSFSSMSDSDLSPWSYISGQLATNCGFSPLLEGRTPALTFSEQTAMSIWSWDLDQPPTDEMRSRDRRCGAMKDNGRWAVQDCNVKLPVACRQIGTSAKWIVYEKGAANYRDVTCPDGYQFDVPRTGRENQALYSALQSYLNATAPTSFAALMAHQKSERDALRLALENPFHALLDPAVSSAMLHYKRHDTKEKEGNSRDSDDGKNKDVSEDKADKDENEDEDEDDGEDDGEDDDDDKDQSGDSKDRSSPRKDRPRDSHGHETKGGGLGHLAAKDTTEYATLPPLNGVPGGGMIWIDISSWQTAGCWVPGGVHGICPYQAPDNTVALQEIIKVSTIGGVIILVLAGMFLYLKCRRNVRLRKSSKRRADVRTKLIETEVETVPA